MTAAEPRDTIHVLVIDDHQMFAESVARLLDREDDLTVVGVAASAASATVLAAEHEPDVAVLDYHLPDGDGATVAAALREAHPGCGVVVITGSGDARTLAAAVRSGCSGFVLKTQALQDLVEAVRRVHAGESFIPPSMASALLPLLRGDREATTPVLTDREREVLVQVATGLSNAAVAELLFVSVNTVRNHVQNILGKLGAHSKLEAVAIARREGLIDAPT